MRRLSPHAVLGHGDIDTRRRDDDGDAMAARFVVRRDRRSDPTLEIRHRVGVDKRFTGLLVTHDRRPVAVGCGGRSRV
jgi:hypothetical protein